MRFPARSAKEKVLGSIALKGNCGDASQRLFATRWERIVGDKSPKSKQKNQKQKDSAKEQSKKAKDAQVAAKAKK